MKGESPVNGFSGLVGRALMIIGAPIPVGDLVFLASVDEKANIPHRNKVKI
jgi:hypothetical protein